MPAKLSVAIKSGKKMIASGLQKNLRVLFCWCVESDGKSYTTPASQSTKALPFSLPTSMVSVKGMVSSMASLR